MSDAPRTTTTDPSTATPEEPQHAHPTDEEQAAADAMLARFLDSWNRADGAAYGENYWPDAELVSPTGELHSGREEIVGTHVDLWSGIFKDSRQTGSIRAIRRLGPSFMVVDCSLHLKVHGVAMPAIQDAEGIIHANLKHILAKRSGVWHILYAQNTFIMGPDKR